MFQKLKLTGWACILLCLCAVWTYWLYTGTVQVSSRGLVIWSEPKGLRWSEPKILGRLLPRPLPRRSFPMAKVYVVMQNDYPIVVFTSQGSAAAYCLRRDSETRRAETRATKNSYQWYEFELQTCRTLVLSLVLSLVLCIEIFSRCRNEIARICNKLTKGTA